MKISKLYLLSIVAGVAVAAYFYLINFNNMSETELVNSVLLWYAPIIFGFYGLVATRIKERMPDADSNAIRYIFSGKDKGLLLFIIILGCAFFGLVLLLIPLAIFRVKSPYYDLKVSLFGVALLILLLWVFFQVLWPAL